MSCPDPGRVEWALAPPPEPEFCPLVPTIRAAELCIGLSWCLPAEVTFTAAYDHLLRDLVPVEGGRASVWVPLFLMSPRGTARCRVCGDLEIADVKVRQGDVRGEIEVSATLREVPGGQAAAAR